MNNESDVVMMPAQYPQEYNSGINNDLSQMVPNTSINTDLAKIVLDPAELIKKITYIIDNQMEIDGKLVQLGPPLANDHFKQIALGLINSHVGPHISMGSITDEEFSVLYPRVHRQFSQFVTMNHKTLGIHPSKVDIMISVIMNPIFISLTRCRGQNEKQFFGQITSMGYHNTPNKPGQEGPGIMNRIFGR